MLKTISMLLIASTLMGQTSNLISKISELRLYSTSDAQELAQAEGMMNEIIITAEHPNNTRLNTDNHKQTLTDYLTLIANILIIIFFIVAGINGILSKWKKRNNIKKKKGPFSLPPFSNQNIKIGKDYAY